MEDLKYNFKEFTTFLLIHASYADLDFSEDEKKKIVEKIPEDRFEKIHQEYLLLNEGEILQTILAYKGVHYPTPARKSELLSLIREHFSADGEYSRLEKTMMRFLEMML